MEILTLTKKEDFHLYNNGKGIPIKIHKEEMSG